MRRLFAGNNWKGFARTFHDFTMLGRTREVPAYSPIGERPFMLEMPDGCEGKTVPTNTVMMALLWQHYGLDLSHPKVSRWLEQNAPDVKYAVARNKSTAIGDGESAELKVSSDGTIEVYLSLEVDQRFREVSSQYIRSQARDTIESVEPYLDLTFSPLDVPIRS